MVEPPVDPTDRWLRRSGQVVQAVVGSAIVVVALVQGARSQELRGWWWGMAAFLATMAYFQWATSGHGRDQHRRLEVDGDRVTVRLRRTVAVGWAVASLSLSGFGVVGSYVARGEPMFWVLVFATVAAWCCGAFLAPAALRDCRLVLDPSGLRIVSWFEEGCLAWDDLQVPVDWELFNQRSHQLRVRARPGAPSLELRRRRCSGRIRPDDRASFRIPADALDDPVRLAAALGLVAAAPAQARAFHVAVTVPRMLRREAPVSSRAPGARAG